MTKFIIFFLLAATPVAGGEYSRNSNALIIVEQFNGITKVSKQKPLVARICKNGCPAALAETIASLPHPRILTAIAAKETAFRNISGDGGTSQGIFQVQRKHWGPVPSEPALQAVQASKILESLIKAKGLRAGVKAYNGAGEKAERYAESVLRTARSV